MSSVSPLAIAAFRLFFATIIILPFFIRSGGIKTLQKTSRKNLLTLLCVGAVLSIHFATWITSLNLTSVSSSVIFVHVDPIFVAAVSHFIFKERVKKRTVIGIIIAFAGAAVIALEDAKIGETNLLGDLLALVGAIMLGLYILSGRKMRQSLNLASYVTPVYATSALFLFLGSIATGTKLISYPPREYLLLIAIAIVPMLFGHTVYNWALRYVKAPIVSITLLGEPVGATILAFLFLNEAPSPTSIAGGITTLIGIYLSAQNSS